MQRAKAYQSKSLQVQNYCLIYVLSFHFLKECFDFTTSNSLQLIADIPIIRHRQKKQMNIWNCIRLFLWADWENSSLLFPPYGNDVCVSIWARMWIKKHREYSAAGRNVLNKCSMIVNGVERKRRKHLP